MINIELMLSVFVSQIRCDFVIQLANHQDQLDLDHLPNVVYHIGGKYVLVVSLDHVLDRVLESHADVCYELA